MSGSTNRQWRLKTRPVGMIEESDFELVETPLPSLEDGQILVRNLYLAFEPAMRGWLDDVKSYLPPVGLGEVMRSAAVGQIVETSRRASRTPPGRSSDCSEARISASSC